ncbi:hypothetical protein [Melghirimyces algeriensis]|uniref:Uncharacterized protein n=1 Tax=Melghirimyces algeriensis TaxID=910412 RepID=A0A521FHN2_9BACL|nr:hypothetical protein [Melghirimyces algeriensis]SMO95171.1 hypothetical protein SAMN06264849_11919 [Melghirimyces algeriensis]
MEHPFPTTQRNPWRSQPFLADNLLFPFVRWLGPEGVKRTPSSSLLEERDAKTEIPSPPLCHELHHLHRWCFLPIFPRDRDPRSIQGIGITVTIAQEGS